MLPNYGILLGYANDTDTGFGCTTLLSIFKLVRISAQITSVR